MLIRYLMFVVTLYNIMISYAVCAVIYTIGSNDLLEGTLFKFCP